MSLPVWLLQRTDERIWKFVLPFTCRFRGPHAWCERSSARRECEQPPATPQSGSSAAAAGTANPDLRACIVFPIGPGLRPSHLMRVNRTLSRRKINLLLGFFDPPARLWPDCPGNFRRRSAAFLCHLAGYSALVSSVAVLLRTAKDDRLLPATLRGPSRGLAAGILQRIGESVYQKYVI